MGWIRERVAKDGTVRYLAVYRDVQGRERSAGTWPTTKKAEAAWHAAEAAMRSGRIGDPKRGRQRFRDYVERQWLPNHVIELSTRESYVYLLDRHIMPFFGGRRMIEIMPDEVRDWIRHLQADEVRPPTIRHCKVVLDAVFSTAFNDQVTILHAGRGVRTPPVARKPKKIITAEQYQAIHDALPDDDMRLLVETDIESGLRWGELTELRAKDLDANGVLTIARAVVQLKAKGIPDNERFVVKDYPKDEDWRQVKLAPHLVTKLVEHIDARGLGPDSLLFEMPTPTEAARRHRPAQLPDPATLGLTEPNDKGRRYRHGTLTAYQAGRCRCRHCKNAIAAYRAGRRAEGADRPRRRRAVRTDGHIPNDWFRTSVWRPAVAAAELSFHVTPHGLRHAHASWLLAGGADLQTVKERLGHGSIATTEKYLHSLPDADDTALKALSKIRAVPAPDASGQPEKQPVATAQQTPTPVQDAADGDPSVTVDLAAVVQTMDPDTVRLLLAGLLQRTQGTDGAASA